jgi:hypothetical protein
VVAHVGRHVCISSWRGFGRKIGARRLPIGTPCSPISPLDNRGGIRIRTPIPHMDLPNVQNLPSVQPVGDMRIAADKARPVGDMRTAGKAKKQKQRRHCKAKKQKQCRHCKRPLRSTRDTGFRLAGRNVFMAETKRFVKTAGLATVSRTHASKLGKPTCTDAFACVSRNSQPDYWPQQLQGLRHRKI